MIPLRDKNRSSTFPVVNTVLIAANVLVFFYELSLGTQMHGFFMEFGLVPAAVTSAGTPTAERAYPFITSMFLHGGFLHLAGNMLYLYIFGDNVEDRLGHGKYLVFYLLTGIAAALGQTVLNTSSIVPMIGASGAISGVLGAYILFFPHAKVVTLIPFYFIYITEIPAFVFLIIYFLMQLISGFSSLAQSTGGGGVAWWAHIGGFIAGLAMASFFRKKKMLRSR
ncbi:MAG: rhomboid family intramembrane serine protease [Candidatus Dadabacteria bacterium]|nr:rhomboid family intramembrane serine protease [Candidatus Dadabacteria bacterium]